MVAGGHDTARAFYGGLLGLEERAVPPKLDPSELVWFRVGGNLELHVFVSEERPLQDQHLCLLVDGEELAAVRARLEAAGVETADTTEIIGRSRFMTRDPFGNRIELTRWEGDPV
jgi:catechol 2,3-dioxygenase-like lactoylglutathione lyase family enzyme